MINPWDVILSVVGAYFILAAALAAIFYFNGG